MDDVERKIVEHEYQVSSAELKAIIDEAGVLLDHGLTPAQVWDRLSTTMCRTGSISGRQERIVRMLMVAVARQACGRRECGGAAGL